MLRLIRVLYNVIFWPIWYLKQPNTGSLATPRFFGHNTRPANNAPAYGLKAWKLSYLMPKITLSDFFFVVICKKNFSCKLKTVFAFFLSKKVVILLGFSRNLFKLYVINACDRDSLRKKWHHFFSSARCTCTKYYFFTCNLILVYLILTMKPIKAMCIL